MSEISLLEHQVRANYLHPGKAEFHMWTQRVRQTVYIHTTYGDINHPHEIRPGFWSTLSPKTFLWDGTENPRLTKSRAGWKAKLRRRLGWGEGVGVALINVYAYWNNTEKMTTYSSASKYHAQQSIS